jgi:predicted GNAT family N-acyltransferase
MSYRILVKNLGSLPHVLPVIPNEYFAESTFNLPTEFGRVKGQAELLKTVFPRIFRSDGDYYLKQFITPKYYDGQNIFVAMSKKSLNAVCHLGYQALRNFDPKAAVLIYVATAEAHRRKGLMKRLLFLACNQLIMMEYERLYCIPDEGTLISDIYQRLGFVPTSEEFTKKHLKHIQKDLPRDSETSSE